MTEHGQAGEGTEAPAESGRSWVHLLSVALQVGLVVAVVGWYRLEGPGLLVVVVLAWAGFVVFRLLPGRLRLPFFALLSMAGVVAVLGVTAGTWVLGLGLVLIALCHLQVPFAARNALVLVAAAILALLRMGWLDAPWPAAVWPILGSMFMFRLMLYLYDMRHGTRFGLWRTLSYFFMLPNACFPLFPVVDSKLFQIAETRDERCAVAQTGVDWMVRGVVQLVLYRWVYHVLALTPNEVVDPSSLIRFLLANYALYLRVSGTFHLITGILRLFSFELPATHNRYFLAAGVPEFWRRINIYWRDFMVKLVFQPLYFRLRGSGASRALAVATAVVFVATWMLHSYQWFWIGGSFPITWQDGVFWGVLGVVMVGTTVRPGQRSRPRAGLAAAAARGGRIVLTFTLVCVLWSLWTCRSLAEWAWMWAALAPAGGGVGVDSGWIAVAAAVAVLVVVFAVASRPQSAAPSRSPWRAVGRNVAAAIALLAAAAPGLGDRLGATAAPVLEAVRSDALSERDVALLQRGYYERIFNARRIEAQIRDLEAARPRYWDKSIRDTPVARNTGDFLEYELVPNTAVLFRGRRLTVNRWGMRDREYEQTRPEGSYRVALLGASYAMGSGVDDGETFDAQLEDRLNREADAGETRYEILNLAVDGYSPLQRLMVLERRGFPLHPDAVFYVGHGAEEMAVRRHILRTLEAGIEPSQPFVREALRELGVGLESYGPDADKRLRRRSWDIVSWVYKDIVRQCTERDIVPVWIHMPTLANYGREKVVWRFLAMAERAGFVVISLDGALDGHEIDNLHVAEWDFHPNAAGHQLFADHLFRQLVEHPDLPAFWPARPESVAADE